MRGMVLMPADIALVKQIMSMRDNIQASKIVLLNGRKGGALSAVRTQCNYLGLWPYWSPIL